MVDRNPDALAKRRELGGGPTVSADGDQVAAGARPDRRHGAEVVFDFVGERGADGRGRGHDPARPATTTSSGTARTIDVPTIEIVSRENNIIGNIVGSYNDLGELMVLAARGMVTLQHEDLPADLDARGARRPGRRPAARDPRDPGALTDRGAPPAGGAPLRVRRRRGRRTARAAVAR